MAWNLRLPRTSAILLNESPDRARRRDLARTALVFLAAAAILYIRLLYLADYFPPLHEGEQRQPLDATRGAVEYWRYTGSFWAVVHDGYESYNKGYFLVMIPFYEMFGYDSRILTYGMPIFFGIYLGAMFVLYRMAYPKASLQAYTLVACMALLCDCLRRTKWHTLAYLPPLAILVFFMPEWRTGMDRYHRRIARIAGVLVYALSCYLYFGCFLYVVPFALLMAVIFWKRRSRTVMVGVAVGGLLAAAAFAVFYYVNPLWSGRVAEEWVLLKTMFTHEGIGHRWLSVQHYFWRGMLSLPYLAFFATGIAVLAIKTRRGDRFALIVLFLYVSFLCLQFSLEDLHNPDQLNWWMLQTLLVILFGADTLLRLVRERLPAGRYVALAIMVVVGWYEIDRYPDYIRDIGNEFWTQTRDTKSESALVLRTIAEDHSGRIRYFLPDPAVPEGSGGFDYSVNLMRPEFGEALSRVVFFTDESDLRRKIRLGPRHKWVVVYLSTLYPTDAEYKKKIDPARHGILGLAPEWVNPYADVYRNAFLVRKFWIRPAQFDPAP